MLCYFDRIKKTILKIDVFNYVNSEILSQYDNKKMFHLVTFFNKNIISTKCNYEIYNKKLLIIIRCLKH